ncbi:MAG: tetratricopeptide repeat protein [Bacteroides sp.]|nr:tetratricopeptide repeat protein [Prevotella sp.]MCM1407899.1 tetratricopeptide repeat protein [Treponema brennaborense]MCM1469641.1 tetratricopeptide repeat protein [Bacteroides sp.]
MKNIGTIVKRKNKIAVKLVILISIVFVFSLFVLFLVRLSANNAQKVPQIKTLYEYWDKKDYAAVHSAADKILTISPWQNTALMFKGYAAFFIALSQTDVALMQSYLDESIYYLRIALQKADKSAAVQIQYMLGKAYFHKNTAAAYHYYSDLAVKYLSAAQAAGYQAEDLPELLGLLYADLNMTEKSIAAFTDALLLRESDTLLLAIARQYYNSKRNNTAKQYLHRISTESEDDLLIIKSNLLLAQIYMDEEKYTDAENEYIAVLKKNEDSADAYYGLGVLYEKRGDAAKARAEWRRALKIKPDHPEALKKLGL